MSDVSGASRRRLEAAAALREQQNVPGSAPTPVVSAPDGPLQRALGLLMIQQQIQDDGSAGVTKRMAVELQLRALPEAVVAAARTRLGKSEVDASSSPSLPTDEDAQAPASKGDQGIPDWAKEEYVLESRRTLMCSMTPTGFIGSIYFPGGTRIRTTHAVGDPALETHDPRVQESVQVNVDETAARVAFNKHGWEPKYFDGYLLDRVGKIQRTGKDTFANVPPWATPLVVPTSSAAEDQPRTPKLRGADVGRLQGKDGKKGTDLTPPREGLTLLEIFRKVDGSGVLGEHFSRGAGSKFDTDKQTVSVLLAALEHLERKGITEVRARNIAFYDFVKSRLPNFAPYIRDPGNADEMRK